MALRRNLASTEPLSTVQVLKVTDQVEVCDDGVKEEEDVVPAQEVGDSPAALGSGVDENPGHVDRRRVEAVDQLAENDPIPEDSHQVGQLRVGPEGGARARDQSKCEQPLSYFFVKIHAAFKQEGKKLDFSGT